MDMLERDRKLISGLIAVLDPARVEKTVHSDRWRVGTLRELEQRVRDCVCLTPDQRKWIEAMYDWYKALARQTKIRSITSLADAEESTFGVSK